MKCTLPERAQLGSWAKVDKDNERSCLMIEYKFHIDFIYQNVTEKNIPFLKNYYYVEKVDPSPTEINRSSDTYFSGSGTQPLFPFITLMTI